MLRKTKKILLTNDDGIESPGLWAAAKRLSEIGDVTVAAPRDQVSSSGRSRPGTSDHSISPIYKKFNNTEWVAYSVGGTPAQVVLHGMLEIMEQQPDLVVAGINYGENFGLGVTLSGTVGAAIEAAVRNVPAIAVSLQLLNKEHYSNFAPLDFSVAANFTALFAELLLRDKLDDDVDLLKIEVPACATDDTAWRITKLARRDYYQVEATGRLNWDDESSLIYHNKITPDEVSKDSDIYAVLFDNIVSVTPLSLDMTSRVDLKELDLKLRHMLSKKLRYNVKKQ